MSKTTLKLKCDSISQNANNGQVRFVNEKEPLPPKEPGQPPVRVADTVLTLHYTEPKEVTKFVHGEIYNITIEKK